MAAAPALPPARLRQRGQPAAGPRHRAAARDGHPRLARRQPAPADRRRALREPGDLPGGGALGVAFAVWMMHRIESYVHDRSRRLRRLVGRQQPAAARPPGVRFRAGRRPALRPALRARAGAPHPARGPPHHDENRRRRRHRSRGRSRSAQAPGRRPGGALRAPAARRQPAGAHPAQRGADRSRVRSQAAADGLPLRAAERRHGGGRGRRRLPPGAGGGRGPARRGIGHPLADRAAGGDDPQCPGGERGPAGREGPDRLRPRRAGLLRNPEDPDPGRADPSTAGTAGTPRPPR